MATGQSGLLRGSRLLRSLPLLPVAPLFLFLLLPLLPVAPLQRPQLLWRRLLPVLLGK